MSPCNMGVYDTFYSSNVCLSRTYVYCAEFPNMKTHVRKSKASLPFYVGLNFILDSLEHPDFSLSQGWITAF